MTPLSHWLWFHAALLVVLGAEYALARRLRNRPDGTRLKAVWATALWVTVAVGLAALLVRPYGRAGATQYLAAYVLEQTLSIDNLFVFLLLFRLFRVPSGGSRRCCSGALRGRWRCAVRSSRRA